MPPAPIETHRLLAQSFDAAISPAQAVSWSCASVKIIAYGPGDSVRELVPKKYYFQTGQMPENRGFCLFYRDDLAAGQVQEILRRQFE
jgi:hypothetical protein